MPTSLPRPRQLTMVELVGFRRESRFNWGGTTSQVPLRFGDQPCLQTKTLSRHFDVLPWPPWCVQIPAKSPGKGTKKRFGHTAFWNCPNCLFSGLVRTLSGLVSTMKLRTQSDIEVWGLDESKTSFARLSVYGLKPNVPTLIADGKLQPWASSGSGTK